MTKIFYGEASGKNKELKQRIYDGLMYNMGIKNDGHLIALNRPSIRFKGHMEDTYHYKSITLIACSPETITSELPYFPLTAYGTYETIYKAVADIERICELKLERLSIQEGNL